MDQAIIDRVNEILNENGIEYRSAYEWRQELSIAIENGDLLEISALSAAQYQLEK